MNANPSGRYTCLHTISLAENADPAAFEQAMVDEIMPRTQVVRRNIRGLSLEHRLLRRVGGGATDPYIWQVQVSELDVMGQEVPDYDWLIGQIEAEVREALKPWGQVGAVSAFQDLGGVDLA